WTKKSLTREIRAFARVQDGFYHIKLHVFVFYSFFCPVVHKIAESPCADCVFRPWTTPGQMMDGSGCPRIYTLPAIDGEHLPHPAFLPALDPHHHGGYGIGVRGAHLFLAFAEAFAPDLDIAHGLALHSAFNPGRIVNITDILPAPVIIHAVPIIGEEHIQIIPHDALTVVLLHRFPLFLPGVSLKVSIKIQLFSRPVDLGDLRPYLLNHLAGHLPRLALSLAGNLDVPEPAVAGNVAEIPVLAVGRAEEHALPWVRSHPPPKTGTVFVVLPGNKGFDLVDVRLSHARKLADLQNPVPLQFLSGCFVVHVRKGKAVREPFPAQRGNQGAFANALSPI